MSFKIKFQTGSTHLHIYSATIGKCHPWNIEGTAPGFKELRALEKQESASGGNSHKVLKSATGLCECTAAGGQVTWAILLTSKPTARGIRESLPQAFLLSGVSQAHGPCVSDNPTCQGLAGAFLGQFRCIAELRPPISPPTKPCCYCSHLVLSAKAALNRTQKGQRFPLS